MGFLRLHSRERFIATLTLGVLLCGAQVVQAGMIGVQPAPSMTVGFGDKSENGLERVLLPDAVYESAALARWEAIFDSLPPGLDGRAQVEFGQRGTGIFVLNNILVTNNTGAPQNFVLDAVLPVAPFGAPNLISGTITTSVIDGGFDGATVAALAGESIYEARIDGAAVAFMQSDPFALTAVPTDSTAASATFGPTVNAVPITTSIGIGLSFSLSAGDTAAILSRFDVNVIPEPGSICGFALALAMVVRRRRETR